MHKTIILTFLLLTIFFFGCENEINQPNEDTHQVIELDLEWVSVPSGEFTYGKNNDLINIEYNFEVMKYEVTNFEYAQFLNAQLKADLITVNDTGVIGYFSGDSMWIADNYEFYALDGDKRSRNVGKILWDGNEFKPEEDYKNHPVIYVSWFGANAFAQYYGYSLPTELEWEKTARGNTGYLHPWGNSVYSQDANFWNSDDPWERGTTPVGYYNGDNLTNDRPSPFGAYDMCGNVWEWCSDFWAAGSKSHTLKGGGWNINGTNYYLRSYTRDLLIANKSTHYIGFRCIRKTD